MVSGTLSTEQTVSQLTSIGISQKFIGYNQPEDTNVLNAQHPTLERVTSLLPSLGKLGALFFFRRIFCATGHRDIFNFVSAAYIAVVAIWIVVFFVMTWNLCGHHGVTWDVQVGHSALCKLDYPYFKATTISDFILEVFILSLPIPKIWNLNMVTSRKVAVTGVFLLALVGLAASIARMVITLNNVNHGVHVMVNGKIVDKARDVYRTQTRLAYCIILETGFTIVAMNLPSLWYYMAGITPESIIRSVRSLVSLSSGHDSQNNSFKQIRTPTGKSSVDAVHTGRALDTTSASSIKLGSASTVESYAMTDLDIKSMPKGVEGIRIDLNFYRTEDPV
ncbi:hypothetical protein B7494_g3794 [Chlorociboria aeruginascens]|nr:hypothetical protein B7494_g3794 [Chlorociboria aeruginascens]